MKIDGSSINLWTSGALLRTFFTIKKVIASRIERLEMNGMVSCDSNERMSAVCIGLYCVFF
jgi:hypothetical protein